MSASFSSSESNGVGRSSHDLTEISLASFLSVICYVPDERNHLIMRIIHIECAEKKYIAKLRFFFDLHKYFGQYFAPDRLTVSASQASQ